MSKVVHYIIQEGSGLTYCGIHSTAFNNVYGVYSKIGATCKRCLAKLKKEKSK